MTTVRVQTADFDVGAELTAIRQGNARIGGIVSFVGVMRDMNDGSQVSAMTLEHYPGMTERALAAIVARAGERWNVIDATVIHRVGSLCPLDQIVLVIVASAHRGDAFAASEFIMDYLKSEAPFWKQEITPTGSRWVDARVSDEAARARWE